MRFGWFRRRPIPRDVGDRPGVTDGMRMVDPALVRVEATADAVGLRIYLGDELLVRVTPPPGTMLLDAALARDDDGREELVGALYDLGLQRGAVVRWPVTRDPRAVAPATPLLDGEAGSVFWRFSRVDGAWHVRDARHHVTHRLDARERASTPA